MLQKFRAARAAAKAAVAPAPPTPASPAGLATVESLGQQLRGALPERRLQSVSLCDHEANVLWLSEGALGPDEHTLVVEALEALAADASLPCHETAVEDGRLAVFLPVRAPMGNLVGVAMILADSKSVGDDTLERLTAAPVRTIMQRLAVVLKPSASLEAAAPAAEEAPQPAEAAAGEVELGVLAEVLAATPAPAPERDSGDGLSEISAHEIANILELELETDEVPPAAAPAPPRAPVKLVAAAPAASESSTADSGMLKLEFLAEPPVVQPAPNPIAVAKKLHAASKAAEVAPTRGPRPLAPTPGRAGAPAAAQPGRAPAAPAAAANGKVTSAVPPAKGAALAAPARSAARPSAPLAPARNPFEPVPANSRLSLEPSDDVVVLFDSDPGEVPPRPAPPANPQPQPRSAPAARPAAQPPRAAAAPRSVPPPHSAPAVRTPTAARPAPAAPAAPAAPVAPRSAPAARAPAPVAAPVAAEHPAPAPSAPSLPLDLVPFTKLRAGGQTRRFEVQPRAPLAQRNAAAFDEQTLQHLLEWLAANRAEWNGVPTSFTVNLSIATLEDERFLQRIGAALQTHGIAGDTLGFEIAESLCAQQRAKVERFFSQCEKLGTWIAIDDFSFDSQVLPLLRSRALRLLKLDARLTAAALRDKLSQAMVVATVQAAKVLGIHCSAKKADSHASLQYLAAIGLDYAQGAALSKAVPLEDIATVADPRPSAIPHLGNNE